MVALKTESDAGNLVVVLLLVLNGRGVSIVFRVLSGRKGGKKAGGFGRMKARGAEGSYGQV